MADAAAATSAVSSEQDRQARERAKSLIQVYCNFQRGGAEVYTRRSTILCKAKLPVRECCPRVQELHKLHALWWTEINVCAQSMYRASLPFFSELHQAVRTMYQQTQP
jgi:hypothetical protein